MRGIKTLVGTGLIVWALCSCQGCGQSPPAPVPYTGPSRDAAAHPVELIAPYKPEAPQPVKVRGTVHVPTAEETRQAQGQETGGVAMTGGGHFGHYGSHRRHRRTRF